MLAGQLFSLKFIAHNMMLPAVPSLQPAYRLAPASWAGRTQPALDGFEARCTGQSHERWLYP
jgi:hypothetical protein